MLVVDNEPASTHLIRDTLESSGLFEVYEVNDPALALEAAHRFRPQLALLDIVMSGLDGSEVARKLRADPGLHALPILFMTSYVPSAQAGGTLYASGHRILAKPVTVGKLLRGVADLIEDILRTGQPAA